jgi:DNA-binding NarL/FixJ family response regulator
LLVVPIALAGWRWGPRLAWTSVAAATALLVAHDVIAGCGMSAIGYLSRATAYATVGALAGALHRSNRLPLPLPLAPIPDDLLSKRELEVLAKIAEGWTNAEIADRLVIAESTVKSHVKNILRKLGAANRTEAVCWYCGSRHRSSG